MSSQDFMTNFTRRFVSEDYSIMEAWRKTAEATYSENGVGVEICGIGVIGYLEGARPYLSLEEKLKTAFLEPTFMFAAPSISWQPLYVYKQSYISGTPVYSVGF
jgi:hypothetical protein